MHGITELCCLVRQHGYCTIPNAGVVKRASPVSSHHTTSSVCPPKNGHDRCIASCSA